MNAPHAVVFLIGPSWVKGARPKYPSPPKPESWRPLRTIPSWDKQLLKRRVDEFRKAAQPQVEALREAGRMRLTTTELRRA
jgi:hypothetical protein